MNIKNLIKYLMTIAVLMFAIGQAQATLYNVDLTGIAGNGNYSSGPGWDQWADGLTLISSPVTVQQGDEIFATVTLDTLFTIPASINATYVDLFLSGDNFPAGPVVTNFTPNGAYFYNGSTQVAQSSGCGAGTSGAIASTACWGPPNNTAITFDSFTYDFTIDILGGPATLQYAAMVYYLTKPGPPPPPPPPQVPELTTMLLLGLGLIGVAGVRRKIKK
jgi:hypothetical protein